jgi:phosphate-selective porin
MRQSPKERKAQSRIRLVRLLIPGLIFCSCLVSGQEKKEEPAVASSLKLQLSGYTQVIYTYWDVGVDTFVVRRARLSLTGELVKKIRFKLQVDATRNPILVDAQIDFVFRPELDLRIGQFYLPFSRENRTSAGDLDTVLRSQVVEKLAPGRDNGSLGRDIGVMVTGKFSMVEYMAGIFNGAGINKLDTNEEKDLSARLVLNPTEFLAVGGSVYDGRHNPTQGVPPVTRDRVGLEAALTLGAFSLKSEYISGKDDRVSKSGWYAQGLYNILPKKLQAVVKWDSYHQDKSALLDRTDILTLGANWFFAARTKLMVNYDLYRREGEGTTNWAVFVQFQAGF